MAGETAALRLFLIDVSSYIFRAFHAIPPLSNKDGRPTNAVLGVANMLLKLLNEEKPDRIAVVYDAGGPTFRDELFDDYKANREEMPDALRVQLPYVRRVIEAFRLPSLEISGVEADDVIATLVGRFASPEIPIVIVTGDKDLMQLVGPHVTLLDTMRNRRIGAAEVRDRFGVEPAQVVEILGLVGDPIDNIPGVAGIGDKTAQALIAKFGSIDGLLERLDDIETMGLRGAKRVREALARDAEKARLSRELASLHRDVPLEVRLDDLQVRTLDFAQLRPLFFELGFRNLLNLLAEIASRESTKSGTTGWVDDRRTLEALLRNLEERERISLEPVIGADDRSLSGIAIGLEADESCVVRFRQPDGLSVGDLAPLLGAERPLKVGGDLKRLSVLLARVGIDLRGLDFDVGVASYVVNPSRQSHRIDDLSVELLGRRLVVGAEESDTVGEAAAERARTAF
ncbi:MAG: 5'-3' exonuclease H3TH domain-containing protein, partial [Candidatus Binatia bacterium]